MSLLIMSMLSCSKAKWEGSNLNNVNAFMFVREVERNFNLNNVDAFMFGEKVGRGFHPKLCQRFHVRKTSGEGISTSIMSTLACSGDL